MITCSNCQFKNPGVHKFCQRCGEPLASEGQGAGAAIEEQAEGQVSEQAADDLEAGLPENLPAQHLYARLMPPDKRTLSPATYLDAAQRYWVVTVLSSGNALVEDRTPEVRSPLQEQLPQLAGAALSTLQAATVPAAAYPYLMLAEAAPQLYDAVVQDETTALIMPEKRAVSPLLTALSAAVDPLQYVYWMYSLIELWGAIAPIPQWRSSLIQADNLGIDTDQSLRIRYFIEPSIQPPTLSDLKGFLQSLLAQPHRGAIPPLRQVRQIILAVTSATTLASLSQELAAIGESLLGTPEAMTPSVSAVSLEAASKLRLEVNDREGDSRDVVEPGEDVDAMTLNDDDNLNRALPAEDEPIDMDDATMLLPMRLDSLIEAGRTDVGKQRDHNEDCFLIASSQYKRADNQGRYTQAHGLYVLCDGMGGHAGGEVASALAAQTLSDYFDQHWPMPNASQPDSPLPTEAVVVAGVKLANRAIYEVNEQEGRAGHERMGTTLVLVLLQGTEAVVAHVGDSRLYQHNRRMGLQQVTVDHEVGQREIKRGIPAAVAYARPDAYQLTQALGPRDSADLQPSVTYLKFVEDTLLLLCSDGLSDNDLVEDYLDSHIDPLLKGKQALAGGLDELVDLANEVNGHDNISVIALQIKVSPDSSQMNRTKDAGQTRLQ